MVISVARELLREIAELFGRIVIKLLCFEIKPKLFSQQETEDALDGSKPSLRQ